MALFRRILSLGKRASTDREIDAELREHMAMCIDDNMAQGMSREAAERDARRRFGNPAVMRERVLAEDIALGLESLWHDVRSALRVFVRNPGFSFVVIATLALGIGANTALFELLDAVLLQSLPVKNPRELAQVRVVDLDKARGDVAGPYPVVTNPIWENLREDHPGFSGIAAWHDVGFSRDSGGDARFVSGLYVSGEFFRVLGVRPVAGRVFTAEDDRPGCGLPGAIISYGFWQQEFGGRPALGQKLRLNDKTVDVIGITPANFFGVAVGDNFDVAVPICAQPYLETKNLLNSSTNWWLSVIGRLDPAWSVQQVAAHLGATSRGIFASTLRADYPPGEREGLPRVEAHRRAFGGRRIHAARDVFRSPAVSTRDRRPGAPDNLRQPRQLDAGPDDLARARHGRAAGHWRRTVAVDPAGAGGEPAAVDCRGSGRRGAGSGVESRAVGVSRYFSRLQAGLAPFCLSTGDLAAHMSAFRVGCGAAGFPYISGYGDESGKPRHDGKPGTAGLSRRAGSVASGSLPGAAVLRTAVHSEPP
jgi:MacB-like protein